MRTVAIIAVLLAGQASAEGYGFRTPSGNIYCNGSIDGGNIQCSIVERSGTPAQPDPGSCSGVWGHHFELERTGPARVVCGSAPRKSTYTNVAAYGETGRFGAITCQSETSGLTCRNQSGNGFMLSRRVQQAF
ncbi:MAG: DUF6636 domain-containing protein [Pseudomonadota bacterium]